MLNWYRRLNAPWEALTEICVVCFFCLSGLSFAAEADKPVVDPGAESESAAAAPSPHEDKPKEEVAEPSPTPAPVEPSAEEKTDDEGTVSNKTSVESLKETNDNNSNNADFRPTGWYLKDLPIIANLS